MAVFEGSNISKTGEATSTKTGVHAFHFSTKMSLIDCINFKLSIERTGKDKEREREEKEVEK